MKKRLFISAPLPDYLEEYFVEAMEKVRISGVKWTSHKNLHITLHFIGYVEEEKIGALGEIIGRVVARAESVKLKFEKAAIAPPNGNPRMVWALFEDVGGGYKKLAMDLADALGEFGDSVAKEPIPHVTLARFDTPSVAQSINLETLDPGESPEFSFSRVELMESRLSKSGPIYTVVRSYDL